MHMGAKQYRYHRKENPTGKELQEKVLIVRRVTKVVKGGRRFRFSALVVVGDGKGTVGYGLGKSKEVIDAITKAGQIARKNLYKVPVVHGTVPHEVEKKYGATRVLIKPAAPGTGVKAGGAMRAILEAAGYTDVLCKVIGSSNPHNALKATLYALLDLRMPGQIAELRGIPLEKVYNG